MKKGNKSYFGCRGYAAEHVMMRYKVEQGFGTMKRQFGLSRVRYMTTVKVQAQVCWAALGMNLLKAHNAFKQMQRIQGIGAPNMSR